MLFKSTEKDAWVQKLYAFLRMWVNLYTSTWTGLNWSYLCTRCVGLCFHPDLYLKEKWGPSSHSVIVCVLKLYQTLPHTHPRCVQLDSEWETIYSLSSGSSHRAQPVKRPLSSNPNQHMMSSHYSCPSDRHPTPVLYICHTHTEGKTPYRKIFKQYQWVYICVYEFITPIIVYRVLVIALWWCTVLCYWHTSTQLYSSTASDHISPRQCVCVCNVRKGRSLNATVIICPIIKP